MGVDLVVLLDYLVVDLYMVCDLYIERVLYFFVWVCDGIGMVGFLVVFGVISCFGCVDLYCSDCDVVWLVIVV